MRKIILFSVIFILSACAQRTVPMLTVMSHDSFEVGENVIAAFEDANQVEVVFLKAGDAGEALSKAILSADAPLADVFYGVDNTFLSRALDAGIFEAYESPLLAVIPDSFKIDPTHSLLPVDYGDVCINYDKSWFEEHDLQVPASLEELLEPDYNGLLVVENPATSSPGLAFLMATVAHFGESGYLDFWRSLRENGVAVVDGVRHDGGRGSSVGGCGGPRCSRGGPDQARTSPGGAVSNDRRGEDRAHHQSPAG